MKKIKLLILISIVASTQLFCSVFNNNKNINVLETKSFDIIFDDESVDEAFLLYNNCEKIYQDILNLFDLERTQRINVVITSDIQKLNAYFSIFPSPHIVLYNTVAINNNLNVFSTDYILQVFKHELTHALTIMGKNNTIRKVFSQVLTPTLLNFTDFSSEGFAVVSESENGEGRLNNASYKARILESIVENKFPKYYEVQGNRDIYPSDVFYLYGAFFNQYLIDEYGIDKFREYIRELEKLQLLFFDANYTFNKVYNKSIFDVYCDFEKSFELVNIHNLKYDTLDYNPTLITKAGNNILVYEDISSSIKDIKTNLSMDKFVSSSTYDFSFNNDKLVLSEYVYNPLASTQTVVIKNNEKKYIQIENFKNAIAYKDDIVGVYNDGMKEYLAFSHDGKIYKKISLKKHEYVQEIGVYNDKIVILSRFEGKDYISILENDEKRLFIDLKTNIEILDFSIYKDKIILSSVRDNELSRLSYINLETNELFVSSFDVMGGVNSPIILNDKVYYIAKLFEENELRVSSLSDFDFDRYQIETKIIEIKDYKDNIYDYSLIKDYKLYKYLLKGSFFPFVFYDGSGISTSMYYLSIDPSEKVNLQLFTTSNFYDEFPFYLNLNLSNSSTYKENSLNITVDTDLTDVTNTTTYDIDLYNGRIFDLYNNTYSLLALDTNTDIVNSISINPKIGYGFSTIVGPTSYNIFSYYFEFENSETFNFNSNTINTGNSLSTTIKIPSLLFFIDYDKATINLPLKLTLELDLNNYEMYYDISLLLFNFNIQKSFKKIPIFFNDIQAYLNYNKSLIKKEISATLIFPSSFAQTMIFSSQISPGIRYTYDLENQTNALELNLFASF
ncbi:MAG: hypothetical protein PQJ45_04815 [Sphaerochaetaceae bacterium]|nr:hypothetical protein [Sphaerochaetaceae bacterium]